MSYTLIIHQSGPTSQTAIIDAYRALGDAYPIGDDQVTVEGGAANLFVYFERSDEGRSILDDYDERELKQLAAMVNPRHAYVLTSSDPAFLLSALPLFPVVGSAAVDNDVDDILSFPAACRKALLGEQWLASSHD